MSLPDGWTETTFGECQSRSTSIDPRKFPDEAFDLFSVPSYSEYEPEVQFGSDIGSTKQDVQPDDVLICKIVPHIRRSWVVPQTRGRRQIASGEWILFRNHGFEPDFLRRFLLSDGFHEQFMRTTSGVGGSLTRARPAEAASIKIPFPPLAEQRRIVAKLDALTARLTRARKELDRVPVLAERLRVSAMHEVFGRGEAELPAGWEMKRIDEIGEVQLGRQRSPKDHTGPNMRPYVRSANITWKGWDLTDVKEMNFSPNEFETFQLRPGDVLLNEGSGSAKEVGKPAIWNGEVEGACFQNTLLRVRPFDYSPELLRYAILYLALSGQFIANTKGVNIIHIGKAGLAKTVLPVPPLDEQDNTLAALDRTFARADRLEAEAAKARALLDRMEAAILARAFRGELVPQDPADEPASVLLGRIRNERAAAPKPKRGRRKKADA